jgi:hypothetical protein
MFLLLAHLLGTEIVLTMRSRENFLKYSANTEDVSINFHLNVEELLRFKNSGKIEMKVTPSFLNDPRYWTYYSSDDFQILRFDYPVFLAHHLNSHFLSQDILRFILEMAPSELQKMIVLHLSRRGELDLILHSAYFFSESNNKDAFLYAMFLLGSKFAAANDNTTIFFDEFKINRDFMHYFRLYKHLCVTVSSRERSNLIDRLLYDDELFSHLLKLNRQLESYNWIKIKALYLEVLEKRSYFPIGN